MLALLIPFLAKKVTDFLGLIQHGKWGAAGRQLAAWAVSTVAVVGAARSPELSAALAELIDLNVADADLGVQLAVGLGLGSAGSAFFDFLKARDNTQSAAGPKLFGPDKPAVVEGQLLEVAAPPAPVVNVVVPTGAVHPENAPATTAEAEAAAQRAGWDPAQGPAPYLHGKPVDGLEQRLRAPRLTML